MAATTEQNLSKLFSQLQMCGEDGEYERGLVVTETILSIAPQDADALHFRVSCLIHLSKFSDALQLLQRLKDVDFERAYCLYRLDRLTESRDLLETLSSSSVRVRDLTAQILYKQGVYSEAAALYNTLCQEVRDEFSTDRDSNRLAAMVTGGVPNGMTPNTMEQYFNLACGLLECGCYDDAYESLLKCEEVGRSCLSEEGCSEEEILQELCVVSVQQGYALHMLGRYKEALHLYNTALKTRPSDVSQSVVASNNIIALRRDKDVFDSKKKMKVLVAEGSSKRLTQNQKLSILYNRALFALGTNQLDACRDLIGQLESLSPDSPQTTLARAALCVRRGHGQEGISLLTTHKSPGVTVSLTLAQLYLNDGQPHKALEVLSALPQLSRHIGLVSGAVGLASSLGHTHTAIGVLDTALSVWRKLGGPTLHQLMLETATYKLSHSLPSEAATVLEELHTLTPHDIKVTALLISSYSRFSPKQAEDLSASLGPTTISTPVDVDNLEHTPSFRQHSRRPVVKETNNNNMAPVIKTPRKKKRKPRLPTTFDPNSAIDKERWLPLRERSYFRRGKKKGFIGRGSQGVTSASASLMAALDANKPKPSTESAESASPKVKPTAVSMKKKPKKKKSKW